MNQLSLIKPENLKPKQIFVYNGMTYMTIKVTVVDQFVEVETNTKGTGLVLIQKIDVVILLGEVA